MRGRQGAQAAVGLLAALVSGGPDSDVDAMTAFARAAVAGGLLRPLLQLARSAQDSSAEAVRRSDTSFVSLTRCFLTLGTGACRLFQWLKLQACCAYMPRLLMNLPARQLHVL